MANIYKYHTSYFALRCVYGEFLVHDLKRFESIFSDLAIKMSNRINNFWIEILLRHACLTCRLRKQFSPLQ